MATTAQALAKKILNNSVIPALDSIGLGGQAAYELVLGTAIQESRLMYRRQTGGGPALGLWQMEPFTFNDIWQGFVLNQPSLIRPMTLLLSGNRPVPQTLIGNDRFAAAMCRLLYRRIPEELPDAGDLEGQAAYWKQYYNTPKGAGQEEEYIANWKHYVDHDLFKES